MARKVLFLTTSAHLNEAAGGRTRVVSESRHAISGHYPLIMLCLVPPRQWKQPLELLRRRRLLQRDAGCPVWYLPALPSFGRRRVLKLTSRIHAAVVFLFGLAMRVGGIHAHGLEAGTEALKARNMGLKSWILFDAHGSDADECAFAAPRPQPRRIAELERDERQLLSSADQVVCVSKAMQDYFRQKYRVEPSHWSVVPCATSPGVRLDPDHRHRVRRELDLEKRLVFVYAGSYRKYQMADEMVALFKQIRNEIPEAFLLMLTGDCARFCAAATQGGIAPEDYRILSLSHEEVLRTLPAADVGFLLRADSPVNRVASPTKFAEYCICGVPILLTPYVGDYSDLVEQEQLGYRLETLQVSPALIAFLRRVQENRDRFARSCHQYASRNLTWNSAAIVLQAAYARLSARV